MKRILQNTIKSSIRLLSYNNDNKTRIKTILKKFLFHVHPDFFHSHKQEQLCNETNVKALLALDIFNDHNNRNDHSTNTRTLTFYIKGSSVTDNKPRRIKISVHRVEDSMREVLETLNVELPPRPEGSQSSSSSYISSNPIDVSAFLDTLIDRKEIIIWRQQRMKSFEIVKDELKIVLGVESIDLRLSYSAENNAIMMKSLLRLIENERNTMCLPWKNLTLTFTADDCSHPVDYIEGEVRINPTHVPIQWVGVLRAVNNDIISRAAAFKSEMQMVKESAELLATDQLRHTFKELLSNNKQKDDSDIPNDELRMILEGLTVNINKGHTCDNHWFYHFLKSLLQVERNNPLDSLIHNNSDDEKAKMSYIGETRETMLMVNPAHKFWLMQLPLNIELVIEHGHGTKLLASGQLRVDCRVKEDTFFNLIKEQGLASIKLIAEQKRRDSMIKEMQEEIINSIGINSIDPGIGISSISMENTLTRITAHINKTNHGGKLRQLNGFNVKIGKYIGLADDGSCILPENFVLQ